MDVGVYEVTSVWDDMTITWNFQPTSAPAPEYVLTVPAAATSIFISWSIDDLVQGWIDRPATNYGVVLKDIDETITKACKGFSASDWVTPPERAKLVISYFDPTDP